MPRATCNRQGVVGFAAGAVLGVATLRAGSQALQVANLRYGRLHVCVAV